METQRLRKLGLALLLLSLLPGVIPVQEEQAVVGSMELELEGPPLVAITFDDGPRPSTTKRLLDGLALREVPATFFLVGERIAGSEELIREMAADGHQVGIHTYDHVLITKLTREEFDNQVDRTRVLLEEILGKGEYWLRPPYGIVDPDVESWADGPLILWSIDPEDWKDGQVNRIVNTVLERVEDGDVILMHDIYDSSVDAALQIVDALLEQGYCFVTVEQLMELRGAQPEQGVLYTSFAPDE